MSRYGYLYSQLPKTSPLETGETGKKLRKVFWLALLILTGVALKVHANPDGMQVMSGQASAAMDQNCLHINASDKAILHWDSFSIGSNEITKFALPDSSSSVLNRVTGSMSSEIMGVLQSNGKVYLINPNGVLFGKDAIVETAGFLASSLDVLDEEFLKNGELLFKGDSKAEVVNLGVIKASCGDVMLIARKVKNEGKIEAENGLVGLASGMQVLLKPSGSQRIFIEACSIEDSNSDTAIDNSGTIKGLQVELVADGNPYARAIRHDGKIDALGVTHEQGRVLLIADNGRIDVTGSITASASGDLVDFGEVRIQAEEIILADNAHIDVSNDAGGGIISVGYEMSGNQDRARILISTENVTLKADALTNGDGGSVMMWGEDANISSATISARGGSKSGNGGFVEISSLGLLDPRSLVDTSAPNGETGVLLFDPTNMLIAAVLEANIGTIYDLASNTLTYTILNPAAVTTINNLFLAANLTVNNVVISTTSSGPNLGDITVSNDVSWLPVAGVPTTLSLNADNDLLVNARITSVGGGVGSFVANAARDVILQSTAPAGALIVMNPGTITVTAGRNFEVESPTAGASGLGTTGGLLTLNVNNTFDGTSLLAVTGGNAIAASATIGTTSGNLVVNAAGSVVVTAGNNAAFASPALLFTALGGIANITSGLETPSANFSAGDFTITSGPNIGSDAGVLATTSGSVIMRVINGDLNINGSTVPAGGLAAISSIAGSCAVSIEGRATLTANSGVAHIFTTGGSGSACSVTIDRDLILAAGDQMGSAAAISCLAWAPCRVRVAGDCSLLGGTSAVAGTPSRAAIVAVTSLEVTVGGNLLLNTGVGAGAGMSENICSITSSIGPVNMSVAGNVFLDANSAGANLTEAMIASGGLGALNMNVKGNVVLGASATATGAGYGKVHISNYTTSKLNLDCGGDLILLGGATTGSYAQIGDDTALSNGVNNDININHVGGSVQVNGALGTAGIATYAVIGHGIASAASSQNANINIVNVEGSVAVFGSTAAGSMGFGQIGHLTNAIGVNTISGNIAISAAHNVFLEGLQATAGADANIGHGPTLGANVFNQHTVSVMAGRNVEMLSAGATGLAQIVNNSSQIQNAITIICDLASPVFPDHGTGYFLFGSNSLINTPSTSSEVRIYSSVRIFNSTGLAVPQQFSALPINGISPGVFPSVLGTNSLNEIWGVYADPTIPGGGAAYPIPANGFCMYYKRTGGVLISNLPTSGGGFAAGVFNFAPNTPEVLIRMSDITAASGLGGFNTTIDAENLSNNVPINNVVNGNSILWRSVSATSAPPPSADITWAGAFLLTLHAGDDIVFESSLTSTAAAAINAIAINAERDVQIGTGAQRAVSNLNGTGGSISITSGRDTVLTGHAADIFIGASVSTGGNGTITTGRDFTMRSFQGPTTINVSNVTFPTLSLIVGRNCLMQAGNDISGAGTSKTLLTVTGTGRITIEGAHTIQGGSGADCAAEIQWTDGISNFVHTVGSGLFMNGGPGGGVGTTAQAAIRCLSVISTNTYVLTATAGNIVLTGGAGGDAAIRKEANNKNPLNISALQGNLIMKGCPDGAQNAMALPTMGAAQIFADAGNVGNITVNTAGDMFLQGGKGFVTLARISTNSLGTTSRIFLDVGHDASMLGGIGPFAPAGISSPAGTDLTINVNGNMLIEGGAKRNSFAGVFLFATAAGIDSINATVLGDTVIAGGKRFVCNAGFYGFSGNVRVSVGNNNFGSLMMTGGSGLRASTDIYSTVGQIVVSVAGDLNMTAGINAGGSWSRIGAHDQVTNNNININLVGGNLVLSGNANNFAQIGNGFWNNPLGFTSNLGDITLANVVGDILLNGATNGSGNFCYAQIGHTQSLKQAGTIGGSITITADGSVILNGGNVSGSYARIGHGGVTKPLLLADTFNDFELLVLAGRNIALTSPTGAAMGQAQIVNQGGGSFGFLTLVTDNLYSAAPTSGPGYFLLGSGSLISAANAATPVSIYTSVRIFNDFDANINGVAFVPNPILGLDNPVEQWGVYGPTGGIYPFGNAFNIYYKRVGGLLISNALADGVLVNSGVYTFVEPEVNLNANDLGSDLDLFNVTFNSSQLVASPLGSSANSIVVRDSFGWFSGNQLMITSSQDLVLDGLATSSGVATASITMNVARNVFVGDGVSLIPSGITVANAPVSITAGGEISFFGGNAINASSLITNNGTGAVTLIAGGSSVLRGGGFSGARAGVISSGPIAGSFSNGLALIGGIGINANAAMRGVIGGNGPIDLSVLNGDLLIRGGVGTITNTGFFAQGTGTLTISVPQGSIRAIGGIGDTSAAAIISWLAPLNIAIGDGSGKTPSSPQVGNLFLQGGMGGFSFSFIGTLSSTTTLSIGNDCTLLGGFGSNAFAQIGAVSLTGNVHIPMIVNNLQLRGSNLSYALIGNNVPSLAAQVGGGTIQLDSVGGNILLQGAIGGLNEKTFGLATFGCAQIGHLNTITGSGILSGDIAVNCDYQTSLIGGVNNSTSYARIGHGGIPKTSGVDTFNHATAINTAALALIANPSSSGAPVDVVAQGGGDLTVILNNGDLVLTGGNGTGAHVTLLSQHGDYRVEVYNGNILGNAGLGDSSSITLESLVGPFSVSCAGSLVLTGGKNRSAFVDLGTALNGNIFVNVGGDCILTSGMEELAKVQIGNSFSTASSITGTIGGHLLINGRGVGYAHIGNGDPFAPAGAIIADINLNVGGNVVLTGTNSPYAGAGFAQIGHLNSTINNSTIAGNLRVIADGTVMLNGGIKTTAVGRIGNGGLSKVLGSSSTDFYGVGAIDVLAGGSLLLNSTLITSDALNLAPASAEIVNLCSGRILLATDNFYPTASNSGTGYFLFSKGSEIFAQPGFQVKIYTSTRIFNNFVTGLVVNGQPFVPSVILPVGPLPQGIGNELWGYYASTDVANPYVGPGFTIYYKHIGGILISSGTTTPGVSFAAGNYNVGAFAEVNINNSLGGAQDLLTALAAGDIVIDSNNLIGTSTLQNSILLRDTLAWPQDSSLTLRSAADINIVGQSTSTSAALTARGISLQVGRDVLIGATSSLTSFVATTSGPIQINAGRDVVTQGSSIPYAFGQFPQQIHSLGVLFGAQPITVHAGRNISCLGGPSVFSAGTTNLAGIQSEQANIVMTVDTGNLLCKGAWGTGATICTIPTVAGQGNITINVSLRDLSLLGGTGAQTGSVIQNRNNPATVAINVGDDLTITSGYRRASPAGIASLGDIRINTGGNIPITASANINSYVSAALIIGQPPIGSSSIRVGCQGSMSITGGGGGGNVAGIDLIRGEIRLNITGNLTLTAGEALVDSSAQSYIGCRSAIATTDINIQYSGSDLTLNGRRNNFALIGLGSPINSSAETGNITIGNCNGFITLNGDPRGRGTFGFAQIGHPNLPGSKLILKGDIAISTFRSTILNGGGLASAFALIGHGGQPKEIPTAIFGNVVINANENIILNTATGGAFIRAFTDGTISTTAGNNTHLNGFSLVQSALGKISMISGVDHFSSNRSVITNSSASGIDIVCDNLYPNSPRFGLGRIDLDFDAVIMSPGPVRLYSSLQQFNTSNSIHGTINGLRFTPGPINHDTNLEKWFKYYPQAVGGFPYTFFYKNSTQGMVNVLVAANSELSNYMPLFMEPPENICIMNEMGEFDRLYGKPFFSTGVMIALFVIVVAVLFACFKLGQFLWKTYRPHGESRN